MKLTSSPSGASPSSSPVGGAFDGEVLAEVSRSIVQLYRRFYGRGPTRAKTIASGDVLTTVLEETLTTVERTLNKRGRNDLVMEVRTSFQAAMRRDFVEVVERATGRRVVGFSSGVDVEGDLATETFLLEPLPASSQPSQPTSRLGTLAASAG